MSQLRALADRYVETVNRGAYAELRDLFADDAVFLAPYNKVLHRRNEIGEFYESFLPTIVPTIRIATYVEQGAECVYELEARSEDEGDFRLGAIDHATVDSDGLIIRFAVYTK
jgi:ketosteroid isomerase-like protein